MRQNDPTGKSLPHGSASLRPALTQKIFRLSRRANQRYDSARLTRYEGRCARHQRAVRCGGRGSCARRTQLIADGEVVWSWRPGAGAKFCESHRGATVARKPVTGESAKEAVKPLRREGRSVSAEPVCSCARSLCAIARETAGAARTRSSLRPLIERAGSSSKARAQCVARMRTDIRLAPWI